MISNELEVQVAHPVIDPLKQAKMHVLQVQSGVEYKIWSKKKKDKRLLKAIKNEDYVNKLICKSHKHPKMSYICDQIMTEIIVAKMKFKEIKMYAKHKVYNTSKL